MKSTTTTERDLAGDRFTGGAAPEFNLLTNHAHVLLCLAAHSDIRLRDVAKHIGITERGVQRILGELEGAGYISRRRVGRRNTYAVHDRQPLRHPIESSRDVRDLLKVFVSADETR